MWKGFHRRQYCTNNVNSESATVVKKEPADMCIGCVFGDKVGRAPTSFRRLTAAHHVPVSASTEQQLPTDHRAFQFLKQITYLALTIMKCHRGQPKDEREG